jgi:hypothetical protein
MITAAALTFPGFRPPVTRVSGRRASPTRARLRRDDCDLHLRNQGHDLQLPYPTRENAFGLRYPLQLKRRMRYL